MTYLECPALTKPQPVRAGHDGRWYKQKFNSNSKLKGVQCERINQDKDFSHSGHGDRRLVNLDPISEL